MNPERQKDRKDRSDTGLEAKPFSLVHSITGTEGEIHTVTLSYFNKAKLHGTFVGYGTSCAAATAHLEKLVKENLAMIIEDLSLKEGQIAQELDDER